MSTEPAQCEGPSTATISSHRETIDDVLAAELERAQERVRDLVKLRSFLNDDLKLKEVIELFRRLGVRI